ncbi:hypothetical protein V6N12_031179 [Hibiscus sabdariffa]|uniref:Uncharacterized protein n=1 Tax=Hibiscus sabdariffa TaxID=183260 RepID=A0ABR2E8P9_9ROSI
MAQRERALFWRKKREDPLSQKQTTTIRYGKQPILDNKEFDGKDSSRRRVIGEVEEEKLEILREHVFPVRVVAFEEAVEQQCDCCCEKGVESDDISEAKVAADKNHKSTEMLETRDSSRVEESLRKASVEETVVPNSVSHGVDSVEMVERMWEGNKREDWRVLELPSVSRNWSNEEEAGMVHRFDNSFPNNDGLKEIYIQEKVGREGLGDIVPFETYSDVSSPVQRGVVRPKAECPRAKIATATILNNGQLDSSAEKFQGFPARCVGYVVGIGVAFLPLCDY